MDIGQFYHTLSNNIISEVTLLILFFGVFASSVVMVRRGLLDPQWVRSADMYKNIIILVAIVTFTLFIYLSYQVESFKGSMHINQSFTLPDEVIEREKLLLFIMLPIDLIGMVINSMMFAVVFMFLHNQAYWTGQNIATIRCTKFILLLFFSWHLTMMTWWIVYSLFIENSLVTSSYRHDITDNLLFAAIDIALYWFLKFSYQSQLGQKHSGLLSWITVIFFFIYILVIYYIRLTAYAYKYFNIVG